MNNKRQKTVDSNNQLIQSLENKSLTRTKKKDVIKKVLNGFSTLRQIGLNDCQKIKQILNNYEHF